MSKREEEGSFKEKIENIRAFETCIVCQICGEQESFQDVTVVETEIKLIELGWDLINGKWTCHKCINGKHKEC